MTQLAIDHAGLPHVLILGGGFGGLTVARRLAGANARVTLVDQHNHHLFQPLLYQVATGATHAYFGHDEWARFAPALKTLDDARLMRRRILLAFEQAERESDPARRQAWLNFIVVGGGSAGVELAGPLIELAKNTLAGEFRRCDQRRATVRLVEA